MNKSELIQAVQSHLDDISKADAERAVNATLQCIKEGIEKDHNVQLVGFGSFIVGERQARSGINPQTKEKIQIKACKVLKFKPGTALKDSINQ